MKLPKILNKPAYLTAAVLLPIFIAVVAINAPSSQPKATDHIQLASDVTAKPTGTTVQVTTSPSEPSEATEQSTTAPSVQTTSTDEVQAPQDTPSDPTPPVVAVSATLSDWTPYVTDPSAPKQTVSYQYCTYAYSDGSTKQVQIHARYLMPSDPSISAEAAVSGGCNVSGAPAA